jgi:hypothetical protein
MEIVEDYDKICPICVLEKCAPTTTFVCKHEFCQQCIVNWNRECKRNGRPVTCPICRKVDTIWGT